MNVEEIGNSIAQRLIQGVMNHEAFSSYYIFLGLEGYSLCHEYHYIEESENYEHFIKYFISHFNRLIPTPSVNPYSSPNIIPDNWYSYKREDMDINTRRNAVKTGIEKYLQWERQTRNFLEDMYGQALANSEIALSQKIKDLILSVDQEILLATKVDLEAKATDYDMPTIIDKQYYLVKKYKKLLKRKETDYDKHERSRRSYQGA